MMFTDSWDAYIQYLHDWADAHHHGFYKGCSPACYVEFIAHEWVYYKKGD